MEGPDLYVAEHGSGTPLVLLHGGLLTAELSFGTHIPALAAEHRVLAMELQGHGHTPDIDRPVTVEFLCADIARELDRRQIERTAFFGYSLGAMIALEFALLHPDRVDRLVLASVDYRPGDTELPLDRMPTADDFQQMRDAYAAVAPDPGHFDDFAAKAVTMVHSHPGWTDEQLATVTAPTLLIFGDRDFAPLSHAVGLHDALPHASLAVLPHTTHMGVMRQPEVLLSIVLPFLKEDR